MPRSIRKKRLNVTADQTFKCSARRGESNPSFYSHFHITRNGAGDLCGGAASRHVDWPARKGAFRLRVSPRWPSPPRKSEQPEPTATPARAIIRIHGAREIKLTLPLPSPLPPSSPSCSHFDLQHRSLPVTLPPPLNSGRAGLEFCQVARPLPPPAPPPPLHRLTHP